MARAYTPGNNLPLLPWLTHMNKLWKPFREDDLALCTKLGPAELMLSGATTEADHHYVFPAGLLGLTDRHVPWSPKEFENIILVNTFPMLCIRDVAE